MCRTAFAAFTLAVLAMAGVESAQATQPAKTQRRSAAAGTKRAAKRPALNRSERVSRGAHETPIALNSGPDSSGDAAMRWLPPERR